VGGGALTPAGAGRPALLLVSFGGPEGPDDVLPFLRNVTRGRNIPDERLAVVGEHYQLFGGVSPINGQNAALLAAIKRELPDVPVYWGNRNWRPYLTDALAEMRTDGIEEAYAFVTSAYSSYSGCRQYRENLAAAQAEVGDGAPRLERLRQYFNHPGFVEPLADNVAAALRRMGGSAAGPAHLLFTAHSIPLRQAEASGPEGGAYPLQIAETARLISERLGAAAGDWEVVWQSRSGPPSQPWLEPDILGTLNRLAARGVSRVVVAPIGFISDHMEVVYDLDVEAAARAMELGIQLVRAATVGTDPRFVAMIGELYRERAVPGTPRRSLGSLAPAHDRCPARCCLPPDATPLPAIGGVE
jgi:ferrochelatase